MAKSKAKVLIRIADYLQKSLVHQILFDKENLTECKPAAYFCTFSSFCLRYTSPLSLLLQ